MLLLLLLLDSLNAVTICFLGTWGFCKSKSRVIWGRDWANNPVSNKHREIPASSFIRTFTGAWHFQKLILSVAALMGKKAWHGPGRRREVLWFFHWNWNIVLGEVMWFYTEERFFDFLQIPRFYLSVHFVELVNVHGEVHYVLKAKQNPCCPSPPPPSWPGRACQCS